MKKHLCTCCGKKELVILATIENPGLIVPGERSEKYYSTCNYCGFCGCGKTIKECQQ
jgi:hypothetical protein